MIKNLNSKTLKAKKKAVLAYSRKHTKAIVISSIIIVIAFMTNYPQYAIMTVWCGRQPVMATRFAASYHYFEPGDPYYSIDPFMQYYCTGQDAHGAGFNPSGTAP